MQQSIRYPEIFRVKQHFANPKVEDLAKAVQVELAALNLRDRIKAGETVAITAGSRGINNITTILKTIVEYLQSLGAVPFLVPAMGSHGGGTVAGQLNVLASIGVTEEQIGCEIRASMETIVVCEANEGFPVHFDKHAHQADHVLVCNRIKPHTNFSGEIESGLMKMLLIGLGKHEGAKIYHRAILDYDFGRIIRSVAASVLQSAPIVGGIAILENAYDETAKIAGVLPNDFLSRETELLGEVKTLQAKLPFERADLLIVDEFGKNIAGSGLDTNVIGRKHDDHTAREDEWPKIRNLFVRDLTDASHGNATGIGIAEFCLSRCIEKMDSEKTRINCLTGMHVTAAMQPLDYATDREILAAVLPTIGLRESHDAQIMWIKNTLDLAEVECSVSYYNEALERNDLTILKPPRPLPVSSTGLLPNIGDGDF